MVLQKSKSTLVSSKVITLFFQPTFDEVDSFVAEIVLSISGAQ